MTAASPTEIQPDRLIPIREIPDEITRLNRLLAEAHEMAGEWRKAYERTSIELGSYKRGNARLQQELADLRAASRETASKADLAAKLRDERELIAELLTDDAVGKDCPSCDGFAVLPETRFDGVGADRPTGSLVECEDCYRGRVCR